MLHEFISLMNLRDLVDSRLADIRMSAHIARQEHVSIKLLLGEIALAADLHAEFRELRFEISDVNGELAVNTDPQLLTSAVMNLLNNAFTFTPPGGHVSLRAVSHGDRVHIEVEDECGGIAANKADPFQPFGDRRKHDRSGLGLGLSIARQAVRTYGGDINFRNLPGVGCVFVIDLPMVTDIQAGLLPGRATA